MVSALVDEMGSPFESRKKLFGLGDSATHQSTKINLAVNSAPTLPAIQRYTGVLYDELDVSSLPTSAKKRLDHHVVIFSGLWGVLRCSDPIPDYKLKMGATIPVLGKLSSFWKPLLSTALTDLTHCTVLDLLPNEHSAAWDPLIACHRIRVYFKDQVTSQDTSKKEPKLKTVSHWNKLLKGALVRHLLTGPEDGLTHLQAFKHSQGYVYRPDLTMTSGNTTDLTFVSLR